MLSAWRQQLWQLPSAQHLDTPTLNDHIPTLLDELAAALRSKPNETIPEIGPGQLLELAAIASVLGVVYWLMRERDDRQLGTSGRED